MKDFNLLFGFYVCCYNGLKVTWFVVPDIVLANTIFCADEEL